MSLQIISKRLQRTFNNNITFVLAISNKLKLVTKAFSVMQPVPITKQGLSTCPKVTTFRSKLKHSSRGLWHANIYTCSVSLYSNSLTCHRGAGRSLNASEIVIFVSIAALVFNRSLRYLLESPSHFQTFPASSSHLTQTMVSLIILYVVAFLRTVNAHGRVGGVLAEGKYYIGADHYSTTPSAGWRANNGDNGFASSISSADIICHNQATPGLDYITIAAGNTMELQWTTWPTSHKGPVLDYLAPCGQDCSTVDKSNLQFTKIAEAGLLDASSNPQRWASDDLISNNFTWATTIPSTVAPGKYVLRHEVIALHSASSVGGVQAYPQCFNVEITGSGSDALSSGSSGTKLYGPNDPGVLVNIYYPVLESYNIPGPALMSAGREGDYGISAEATASSSGQTSKLPTPTVSPSTSTIPTSSNVVVPIASSDAGITATAGARKFVCFEEL